ncbi:hypothetical protein O181_018965 [Austropuccinia psidii MF-1]|uniref:Major facilitator superfamily (MFS) profile domain-containing protein n=1 Tax=Austropuccinia psidii MF-1 TaxID=1389203 RepID=A0A9Q3CAV2_9BASI|nr:hypothetical protein [Austropuccinia psidii MF-1]
MAKAILKCHQSNQKSSLIQIETHRSVRLEAMSLLLANWDSLNFTFDARLPSQFLATTCIKNSELIYKNMQSPQVSDREMPETTTEIVLAQKHSYETFHSTSDVESTPEPVDDREEQKALWKFDISVLPILSMFFLLNFLDRANLGNARVAGLQKDLHMTDHQYSMALMATIIPYIAADLPATLVQKKIGSNIFLPTMITIWGIITTLQGFIRSYSGLIAARIFLGAAEGGMFPGIILYLSSCYPRRELQTRIALFYSIASLSGAFSGLLAYGIVRLDGRGGLSGWCWIFIIEGLFTVSWGLLSFFIFPASIDSNKFLTMRQKTLLKQRLARHKPLFGYEDESFSFSDVLASLKSPHVLINSLSIFMAGTIVGGLLYFQPTIINSLGYSAILSQLLSVPPFAFSFVFMLGTALFSDRFRARGVTACFCALISLTGFLIFYLADPHQRSLKYASLFLSISGSYSAIPALYAWQSNNSEGHYRRAAAIALGFIAANSGGILATWIFPQSEKPRYRTGTSVDISFSVGLVMNVIINWLWLRRSNRYKRAHRDEILSKYRVEGGANSEDELNEQKRARQELGDKHPDFIYTY